MTSRRSMNNKITFIGKHQQLIKQLLVFSDQKNSPVIMFSMCVGFYFLEEQGWGALFNSTAAQNNFMKLRN